MLRNTLSDRLPRTFDDFAKEMDTVVQQIFRNEDGTNCWAPRTNVAETDKTFEVVFEVPGVNADDINVELHEGHLVVSGETKSEAEAEGTTYHRIERRYGKFQRTVRISDKVDGDGIEASYRDGLLTVVLPKIEQEKTRKIQVRS